MESMKNSKEIRNETKEVNIEEKKANNSFWDGVIIGVWVTIVIFRIAVACGATLHF